VGKPSNLLTGRKIKGKRFIAGKVYDKEDKEFSDLKRVERSMVDSNILPQTYKPKNSNQESAENILAALNCSFEEGDRYFSLIEDQTDKEVVENPNILDPTKWDDLKNTDILATDKFPESTDNFYELDEALPNAQLRKEQKVRKPQNHGAQKLANDMITYNLKNAYTKTLPQFK